MSESVDLAGLALDGAHGVRDVLNNIVVELDLTMGLTGVRSVADLDRSALQPVHNPYRVDDV